MKSLKFVVVLTLGIPTGAATYTVTPPHLTMHAGDPVPPLIFQIGDYAGSYASNFTGQPDLRTEVTSSSPVGNYKIAISRGSLRTRKPGDKLHFVSGTITVIPPDSLGARLTNKINYPAGFLQGPKGYAAIDVTNNPIFNLVGDCVTDNAAGLSLLLSQNGRRTSNTTNGGLTPLYLYFPPGCYATSEPLTIYGNSWSLWGAGPQISFIRLLPNSPAFNTGRAREFFSPQSVTKNANFREYIYNLGFNIGVGNPDAIPFTSVQNNSGAVRNVQIWADDSKCPYAISFNRQYPGPMLFKNVAVYGCGMAYSASQGEYSVTIENFTTEGQTTVALDDHYLKASIRHWLSDNTVPALHVYGSMVASVSVLDSEIFNGGLKTSGVVVDVGAALYIRNLMSTGYNPTELDDSTGKPLKHVGNIDQSWTGSPQSIFNYEQPPDSLHLDVRETPSASDPPVENWTRLGLNVSDWPSQILHSPSATVYAPPGVYRAAGITQVTIPDTVDHLEFYQAKFPTSNAQMVIVVAGSSTRPLIINGCPYRSCQIVHSSERAIVLLDTTLRSYTSMNGAGDLYVEDSVLSEAPNGSAVTFYPSQRIWARQLNLEQGNTSKFTCLGCKVWILGYKTEQATPSIVLADHAQAEVFGFFFYQNVAPTIKGTGSIYLTDSSLFATGWTQVDLPEHGQPNWIIEKQAGSTLSLATQSVNISQTLNMFYSYGGGLPPVNRKNK